VKGETPNSMDQREVLDALEDALELSIANIPTIPGKTAIFIDVSGSMGASISDRSLVRYIDISRLFGAMADKICDKSVIGVFGSNFAVINTSKKAPTLTKMQEISNVGVGHATNAWKAVDWLIQEKQDVDRILVFSDEQIYDSRWYTSGTTLQAKVEEYRRKVNPNTYLHSIDLAGYETTMVAEDDPKSNLIAGWSEKILDYINFYEQGFASMVDIVENYTLKDKE
jgi:hypothetical protein